MINPRTSLYSAQRVFLDWLEGVSVNLTRQERLVVLFLICVTLTGLGIDFLTKHFSRIQIIGYISQDAGKINLNLAERENLMDVQGIGAKLSQRIIDYRKENGNFKDVAELKSVKGIGESKYEAIKDYFTVDPALSIKQGEGRGRKGGVDPALSIKQGEGRGRKGGVE